MCEQKCTYAVCMYIVHCTYVHYMQYAPESVQIIYKFKFRFISIKWITDFLFISMNEATFAPDLFAHLMETMIYYCTLCFQCEFFSENINFRFPMLQSALYDSLYAICILDSQYTWNIYVTEYIENEKCIGEWVWLSVLNQWCFLQLLYDIYLVQKCISRLQNLKLNATRFTLHKL